MKVQYLRATIYSLILLLMPLMLGLGATAKKAVTRAKAPAGKGKSATAKPKVATKRAHTTRRRATTRRRGKKAVAVTKSVDPLFEPVSVMPNGLSALPILSLNIPVYPPAPPIPGTCAQCTKPLLATAYSLIGTPYRWGGHSPDYGFDCSGFVRYVYQSNYSLALPTSAPAQFHIGMPVEKTELMPGDLVFFHHRRRGWHVGMYVGGGSFIHAPNRRKRVMVTPMSDPYFSVTYVGARRIPLAELEAVGGLDVETNN